MPRPALPVSLYLAGRRVVVVGGGTAAEEQAARLSAAGAEVAVLSGAAALDDPRTLEGAALVVGCEENLLDALRREAHARGALFYAPDHPEASDLAMPAVARRGTLSLAVATDGVAPALARRLRDELQRLLDDAGPALDALLAELAARRAQAPREDRREALAACAERLRVEGRIAIGPEKT